VKHKSRPYFEASPFYYQPVMVLQPGTLNVEPLNLGHGLSNIHHPSLKRLVLIYPKRPSSNDEKIL